MNPKFANLSEEKKMRIINAGMEQFGQYGYKKAVTEDIAVKAGISKGLLFHYFKDKKSFYMYLYDFCEQIMIKKINMEELKEIEDFFDVLSFGSKKKLELIADYPYLMNFCMRAYFSRKEAISELLNERIQEMIDRSFEQYFQYVDFSRFKDDVDPKRIYQMMIWMAEGYLLDHQRAGKPLELDEMSEEFEIWKTMFKQMSYKEEYL